MARPPATTEQRREARDTIRRAAGDLVAEEGPTGVTVRKVATRAGVSVGTVYSHFSNLQSLMRSLWTPVIREANRTLIAVAANHPDPLERLRVLLGTYVSLAVGNETLHRNTLLYVRPANQPTPTPLPLADLDFHRLLVEAVHDGQSAGLIIDGDETELAQVLWAGVHGAVGLPVNTDIYELEPAEQQADLMIRLLLASLSARPN